MYKSKSDTLEDNRKILFLLVILACFTHINYFHDQNPNALDKMHLLIAIPFFAYLTLLLYAILVLIFQIQIFKEFILQLSRYVSIWIVVIILVYLIPMIDIYEYIGEESIGYLVSFTPFFFLLAFALSAHFDRKKESSEKGFKESHIEDRSNCDSESLGAPLSDVLQDGPTREKLEQDLHSFRNWLSWVTFFTIIGLFHFTNFSGESYKPLLSATGISFCLLVFFFLLNCMYLFTRQVPFIETIERSPRLREIVDSVLNIDAITLAYTLIPMIISSGFLVDEGKTDTILTLFFGAVLHALLLTVILRIEFALRRYPDPSIIQINSGVKPQYICINLDKNNLLQ